MSAMKAPAQELDEAARAMRKRASIAPAAAPWHLAIADWLEQSAAQADAFLAPDGPEPGWNCDACGGWLGDEANTEADAFCHCFDKALKVARTYLESEGVA